MKAIQVKNRIYASQAAVLLIGCSWIVTGCAVGGRSMTIDSNSRIPFFGLELKERSRKADGPPLRVRGESGEFRIEPLRLPVSTKARGHVSGMAGLRSKSLASVPVPQTEQPLKVEFVPQKPDFSIDFR